VEPVRAPSAAAVPGGGIARPKPRKYDQKTPKKMIRLALYSPCRTALDGASRVVDSFAKWETPRPRTRSRPRSLGLDGKILVVLGTTTRRRLRSFRNLMNVKTIDKAK